MHLFEAIWMYIKMVYPDNELMKALGLRISELWIKKAKYPYFFDAETKVPVMDEDTSMYRYRNKMNGEIKENIEMDLEEHDMNMSSEESDFVKMRQSIKWTILELSLKLDSMEDIIANIITVGKQIISNDHHASVEDLIWNGW